MGLRIFVLGIWRGRTTYLASGYNRLDMFIVASSWALKVVSWEHYYVPIYPGKTL